MLGEVLISSVDNLVINHESTTTDEANWENHASREHTLSVYPLHVFKIDCELIYGI